MTVASFLPFSFQPVDVEDTNNILDMISEMKEGLPAPLSAIYTPKITNHEGNNGKSVPKYFGGLTGGFPSNLEPSATTQNHSKQVSASQGRLKDGGQ